MGEFDDGIDDERPWTTTDVKFDPNKSWSENDAAFKELYKLGNHYQEIVAAKLRLYGVEDVISVTDTYRQSISEAAKYAKDNVDLLIKGWLFEVKSRGEVFTSVDDFPYPTVFIDTVSSWEDKMCRKPIGTRNGKPIGYIFISQKTRALLGSTTDGAPDRWGIVERRDRVRKIQERFYVAQKSDMLGEPALVQKLKAMPSWIPPSA